MRLSYCCQVWLMNRIYVNDWTKCDDLTWFNVTLGSVWWCDIQIMFMLCTAGRLEMAVPLQMAWHYLWFLPFKPASRECRLWEIEPNIIHQLLHGMKPGDLSEVGSFPGVIGSSLSTLLDAQVPNLWKQLCGSNYRWNVDRILHTVNR